MRKQSVTADSMLTRRNSAGLTPRSKIEGGRTGGIWKHTLSDHGQDDNV